MFSAAMVRAILAGTKTQTRRAVKPRNDRAFGCALAPHELSGEINVGDYTNSAYGQPGERLWVREAYRTEKAYDRIKPSLLPVADTGRTLAVPFWYDADLGGRLGGLPGLQPGKCRPGMFMPRAASRILLEITAIRVERLQDISHADAMAEGVAWDDAVHDYSTLWEQINGRGSWAANPWVWVIEFRRADTVGSGGARQS
ncbi:MAG: hypothetical protein Q7J47_03175 [Azoarcus sp.]|nr:hypothetical protein [Azoarcus sp.]